MNVSVCNAKTNLSRLLDRTAGGLVAQALEEGLTIVTHDPLVIAYGAPSLWA